MLLKAGLPSRVTTEGSPWRKRRNSAEALREAVIRTWGEDPEGFQTTAVT